MHVREESREWQGEGEGDARERGLKTGGSGAPARLQYPLTHPLVRRVLFALQLEAPLTIHSRIIQEARRQCDVGQRYVLAQLKHHASAFNVQHPPKSIPSHHLLPIYLPEAQ